MSWESAENVPAAIVQEFERGSIIVGVDNISTSGICQTVHTLTTCSSTSTSTRHPVVTDNDG